MQDERALVYDPVLIYFRQPLGQVRIAVADLRAFEIMVNALVMDLLGQMFLSQIRATSEGRKYNWKDKPESTRVFTRLMRLKVALKRGWQP